MSIIDQLKEKIEKTQIQKNIDSHNQYINEMTDQEKDKAKKKIYNRYVKKNPSNKYLFIAKRSEYDNYAYRIYNEILEMKYEARGRVNKTGCTINLYGENFKGTISGTIKKRGIFKRTIKEVPIEILIDNISKTTLKINSRRGKEKYEFSDSSWSINHSKYGFKCIFEKNKKEVAKLEVKSSVFLIPYLAYVMDYENIEDESILLLFSIARDVANDIISRNYWKNADKSYGG